MPDRLETDGLGGLASGTAGGIRTRRYHGLLLAATTPPSGRQMLVNGVEAWVTTAAGRFPLSSQRYEGQVVHPEGFRHVRSFTIDPWPTWRFHLPDGTVIEHELFVPHERSAIVLSWRLAGGTTSSAKLEVRPLLSGRDYHALHGENESFRFNASTAGETVAWSPYEGIATILGRSNGWYDHGPLWYRRFFYQEEWLRGFPATEDLASPGAFRWNLQDCEAQLVFATEAGRSSESSSTTALVEELRGSELRRRQRFATPLRRAADQYLVRRDSGKTIIAGYPWFTDWGRDSFIAIRGLCLATDRLDDARQILLSWAPYVSEGMLPNRFPDGGQEPEYNSVDASLWYVIAVGEFLSRVERGDIELQEDERGALHTAVESILRGYARGTRYGIRCDEDGLLLAGQPGVQLTWMDAKIGDWVVTPRSGKAVEVQALWLNAVSVAGRLSRRWQSFFERGLEAFRRRFWNDAGRCLYDVVDCDGRAGAVDPTFRPNQIFAVGGLPIPLLEGERAHAVVDAVEQRLLTPIGLRSLAQNEESYTPRYAGGPSQRDAAYHRGTVWPWLIGPFAEAWVRVRGGSEEAKAEARTRFLEPLTLHLSEAGLGHVSEIADGDAPHTRRGCPFQAWSVAELLRLDAVLAASRRMSPDVASLHPMCG